MTATTVILDLDGTLIDSVYVHTLAWRAAFRDVGVEVPAHRLHRLIGMGGDRLVAAAAGQPTEEALGDTVRELRSTHFGELFSHVTAADGAVELLTGLRDRGFAVVLATSGSSGDTDRLLDLLGPARAVLDAVVTGSQAEHSKPDGELIATALQSVDAETAIVVGDAVWDVRAAHDAGVPCLGVLTGGFSEAELREAGARDVVDSARVLAERLDATGALV